MSSGSGSDPHLLALLRAIRLRQAAPEAAEAGAADASAVLSGGTPGTPRPAGLSPAASPATRPADDVVDAEVIEVRPANVDPVARVAADLQDAEPLPSAHPSRDILREERERGTPAGIGATGRSAASPRAALGIPSGGAPGRPAPTTTPSGPAAPPAGTGSGPGSTSGGTPPAVPGGALPAPPAVPGGALPAVPGGALPAPPAVPGGTLPAVPGGTLPTLPAPPAVPGVAQPALPAGSTPVSNPPAAATAVPPATLPARHVPGGPVLPSTPPPPGQATPPAPATPHPTHAGPVPPWTPVPHHTAAAITPVTGVSFPVDGVPGPARIDRPVPGQHPEPPNPGLLRPATGPAGVVPAARLGPLLPLPADGMDPADDVALRDVQRLLGSSLTQAGGAEAVAERLRAAVLQAQPQLLTALPGNPQWQREQMAQALTWLVRHLDQPPALASGCAQLGAALAECGVTPPQLQLMGAALAEAMRAGITAGGWRQDYDQAWRTTWQHVQEWMAHGVAERAYQPAVWTAVVVSHELRRPDLAVVRLRPYLPMPFRAGQYARVEVPELPGVWRPYSLAGVPRRDNILELHVRAKTGAGVSGALVYRTEVGDKLRFGPAEGAMGVPGQPARDLLLVAGDTGVAPLKAMLAELAETGDRRSAVLFWGVRDLDELYDIEEIADIARDCRRATVVPVVSEGEAGPYASGLVTDAIAAYGEWSEHEVYLAGPPLMLAATSAALQALGVAPERIHHDPQA